MTATSAQPTYGGWRRARSIGLGPLDARQSVLVVGVLAAPILAAYLIGLATALALLVPALAGAAGVVATRDGVQVLDLITARTRWQLAAWRGQTLYRGLVLAEHPRALDLPGLLAPTRLLEVAEPGAGRVGVVWNTRSGEMSATLLLSPAGALLADSATVARQVGEWGHLLASLADDPTIQHLAVTIDVVPDPGTQLADHIAARLDPAAPALAAGLLREVAAAAPQGASRVSARLTLTVAPRERDALTGAAALLRTLGGISTGAAGADLVRRATATDLIRIVRCAYDPDAADASSDLFDQLDWPDAGPLAADDHYRHYRHDGAHSLSWALTEAPRQRVPSSVLLPLLMPGRHPRRVTLTYRTLSRREAGALLERELNAATARQEWRRRTGRDATARDHADADRAARAAAEEAAGAGLVQAALYVTTTVSDPADLPEARREVEQAAGQCRLRLRLAAGSQAAIFAVGLPCGLYPPRL